MIALFYVTNRPGGLDILFNNLARQTEQDFKLIVADELYDKRDHYWLAHDNLIRIKTPKIEEPYKRNLARVYNMAADVALIEECSLMISLQDYIWIPENGIERFKYLHEKLGDNNLYTGLTSISKDPPPEEITSSNGFYTIFSKPYEKKPKHIKWYDVRYSQIYWSLFKDGAEVITTTDVNHWEANWAALPTKLFEKGLRWDEEFDKGYAFENNALAREAINCYDTGIIIDANNHAISLPHFDYWPQEKEDLQTYSNRDRFEGWGDFAE